MGSPAGESTAAVGVPGVQRGQEEAGQSEDMLPHRRHHQYSGTLLTLLGSSNGAQPGNRDLCPQGWEPDGGCGRRAGGGGEKRGKRGPTGGERPWSAALEAGRREPAVLEQGLAGARGGGAGVSGFLACSAGRVVVLSTGTGNLDLTEAGTKCCRRTPTTMVTSKNKQTNKTENNKCRQRCGEVRTLLQRRWECELVQSLWN